MTSATQTKHMASVCWHITIDMDLPWMMRKDLNIQGRNTVVRRWDKEHHIGIAYA